MSPPLGDALGDGVGQLRRHQPAAQPAGHPGRRWNDEQNRGGRGGGAAAAGNCVASGTVPGRPGPDLRRRVRVRPVSPQAPAGPRHRLGQVLPGAVLPSQDHGAYWTGVGRQCQDVEVTGGVGVLHAEGLSLEQLAALRAQGRLPPSAARAAGRQAEREPQRESC